MLLSITGWRYLRIVTLNESNVNLWKWLRVRFPNNYTIPWPNSISRPICSQAEVVPQDLLLWNAVDSADWLGLLRFLWILKRLLLKIELRSGSHSQNSFNECHSFIESLKFLDHRFLKTCPA
jgi:hypothetical protein